MENWCDNACFQKAEPRVSADFRPISCLPLPSKIIGKPVYNQIEYHLESNGLLDSRQHGLRKKNMLHVPQSLMLYNVSLTVKTEENLQAVCSWLH